MIDTSNPWYLSHQFPSVFIRSETSPQGRTYDASFHKVSRLPVRRITPLLCRECQDSRRRCFTFLHVSISCNSNHFSLVGLDEQDAYRPSSPSSSRRGAKHPAVTTGPQPLPLPSQQQQQQQQQQQSMFPQMTFNPQPEEMFAPPPPMETTSPTSRKRKAPGMSNLGMTAMPPTGLGDPGGLGELNEPMGETISPTTAPAKKSRTNTPWTPAEEQRLKAMRDAGSSWGEIAKV